MSKRAAEDHLSAVDIKKVMQAAGPIVQGVLLSADGTSKQIEVDMTPAKREVDAILGGDLTILGQYADLDAILLVLADQSAPTLAANPHKLQPPFHAREVKGNIVILRSDEDGEFTNFTLSEYEEFLKLEIEEFDVEEFGKC
jgi:Family of unknown function (DUF5880)